MKKFDTPGWRLTENAAPGKMLIRFLPLSPEA
jgi:hypothetical protein